MPDYLSLGLVIMFVGSAAIGAGRRILERRRARTELREKPLLTTSSPEGAWVRVTGVVRLVDDRSLIAPLSRKPCVVYRSRVTVGQAITRRALRPVEELVMVPFAIDRGAEGMVAIEGEHALLDLPRVRLRTTEQVRREFAWTQGIPYRDVARAQFEETVVMPGQRVSVAGLVMKDPAAAPARDELGFRDAPPPELRLAGNVEHPIVIGEPD